MTLQNVSSTNLTLNLAITSSTQYVGAFLGYVTTAAVNLNNVSCYSTVSGANYSVGFIAAATANTSYVLNI